MIMINKIFEIIGGVVFYNYVFMVNVLCVIFDVVSGMS